WKNGSKAPEAAEVLKLTAPDLLKMGIIDEIIPEPLGGAHTDPERMAQTLKETIKKNLQELNTLKKEELLKLRYKKFRGMGAIG
ncbi:MAG: acetyl-CoA carboxylase carboxyl transferase subunit alpha, partial [Candidatus Omnitrophota bacterium]|nr:acetyl-CoA carboxylase carboxyl transferase subunit alpha [Candidatus Omnitrophota bacterium]